MQRDATTKKTGDRAPAAAAATTTTTNGDRQSGSRILKIQITSGRHWDWGPGNATRAINKQPRYTMLVAWKWLKELKTMSPRRFIAHCFTATGWNAAAMERTNLCKCRGSGNVRMETVPLYAPQSWGNVKERRLSVSAGVCHHFCHAHRRLKAFICAVGSAVFCRWRLIFCRVFSFFIFYSCFASLFPFVATNAACYSNSIC